MALARAFLRDDADVLVLDEPSSGLDADVILVLESGVVVEAGTHDALMAAGGRYAELFTLQSDGYQIDAGAGPAGGETAGPAGPAVSEHEGVRT